MSVTAIRSSPLKPDVPELLSRARAITDIVRARVQETEANRRISDDVIERMREATQAGGLCQPPTLPVPRPFRVTSRLTAESASLLKADMRELTSTVR